MDFYLVLFGFSLLNTALLGPLTLFPVDQTPYLAGVYISVISFAFGYMLYRNCNPRYLRSVWMALRSVGDHISIVFRFLDSPASGGRNRRATELNSNRRWFLKYGDCDPRIAGPRSSRLDQRVRMGKQIRIAEQVRMSSRNLCVSIWLALVSSGLSLGIGIYSVWDLLSSSHFSTDSSGSSAFLWVLAFLCIFTPVIIFGGGAEGRKDKLEARFLSIFEAFKEAQSNSRGDEEDLEVVH